MTFGAFADSDCVRLLAPPAPDGGGEVIGVGDKAPELMELLELIAVLMVPRPAGDIA